MASGSKPHPIELRIQALSLMGHGHELPDIEKDFNISLQILQAIRKKAFDRGYDPKKNKRIQMVYVKDVN